MGVLALLLVVVESRQAEEALLMGNVKAVFAIGSVLEP